MLLGYIVSYKSRGFNPILQLKRWGLFLKLKEFIFLVYLTIGARLRIIIANLVESFSERECQKLLICHHLCDL